MVFTPQSMLTHPDTSSGSCCLKWVTLTLEVMGLAPSLKHHLETRPRPVEGRMAKLFTEVSFTVMPADMKQSASC